MFLSNYLLNEIDIYSSLDQENSGVVLECLHFLLKDLHLDSFFKGGGGGGGPRPPQWNEFYLFITSSDQDGPPVYRYIDRIKYDIVESKLSFIERLVEWLIC